MNREVEKGVVYGTGTLKVEFFMEQDGQGTVTFINILFRPLRRLTCNGLSFIHSVLRPLLWVANVPCKSLLSAALYVVVS